MHPTRAQVVPYSPPSISRTLSVHLRAARYAANPADPLPIIAMSTLRSIIVAPAPWYLVRFQSSKAKDRVHKKIDQIE
jgi:hypothetical protein